MTAKERSDTAYALCRHCTGMTCNGLCRDCCTDAILAHAEAVREEAALVVERWPTKCNCSAPDIGVGVLHEPGCGQPNPKEVAAAIRAIPVT